MKTNLNRRSFLLNTGVGTLGLLIPNQLFSSSFGLLYHSGINPGKEFSLLKMEKILPDYRIPPCSNFTTDKFWLSYTLYNFYQELVMNAGWFEILKKDIPGPTYLAACIRKATADISIENENYIGKYRGNYIFNGQIEAENDLLASPLKWECETKISDDINGSPYLNTQHRWKGSYKDGHVQYHSGSQHIVKNPANPKLTWKWGIINLVQKMAEQSVSEVHFSTLDEMDMIFDHQYARFRKKQQIDCGTGNVEFSVFDVLGDGIIPTVYWVDNFNRVIFIISGVEAYVLSDNQEYRKQLKWT
jgi:hypothetical protein